MPQAERKLKDPTTLFAAIESSQHEALREIAFKEHRSLAEIVREALTAYLHAKTKKSPIVVAR